MYPRLLAAGRGHPSTATLRLTASFSGVTIINFIRLSWERDELESQMYGEAADRVLRPVWRMTEGFERAYTLQVTSHPLAVLVDSISGFFLVTLRLSCSR